MSQHQYRPDIDGLRTLAVMPVILFHAGAAWLPGGFVGVDIFFVISGYLISSIILREVAAGEFSFARFYERRIRRIVPPLLAVLIVTVLLFQLIALPDQAQETAESGVAALASASNVYFWRASGYFAPSAEFMPLLHTWSLAVEEQFYLLFPVVILGVRKLKLPMKWTFVAGTAATFAIGYWLSVNKPSVAYYLLPARAWELAFGGALAAGVVPGLRSSLAREATSVVGIVLVVGSLFYIRSDMLFPGWVALMPCCGAALVIHSGGESWVSRRILGARPMVFVGLLSYSLYLWHWPLLVGLRMRTASVHLDPPLAAGAVAATFLLAWASWRYVERPFRSRQEMSGRRMLWQLGVGSTVLLAIASAAIATGGFPQRLGDASRASLAASNDIDPLRVPCEDLENRTACRFGRADAPVTYAIIGDSHAAALRPAIEASGVMGDAAGTLYWATTCPLLDGAGLLNHPERSNCSAFKSTVWDLLEDNDELTTVVLAGRWPFEITGSLPESGGSNRLFLVDDETETPTEDESAHVFARSLRRTLERLTALDLDVVIVGSVPEPGFDVPHTMALAQYAGMSAPRGISRSEVEARAGAADEMLATITSGLPRVRFVSIWEELCARNWCPIERDGVLIYTDDDHLSHAGALRVVAPALASGATGPLPRTE